LSTSTTPSELPSRQRYIPCVALNRLPV
jgi:hypothetical protein